MSPSEPTPEGSRSPRGGGRVRGPRAERAEAKSAHLTAGPLLGSYPRRYGRYVGVLGLVILVLLAINVALTKPNGARGIPPGHSVPPFAAPLATGSLNGDVNVAIHAGEGSAGKTPACDVRGAGVLNVCELYAGRPLVLALFVDAGSCSTVLSEMQALAVAFPQVNFAAVAIKGERTPLRRLIRERGLTRVRVGFDSDGILTGLYKMASCPQVSFVLPGGVVQSPALLLTPSRAEFRARVAELRGGRPPAGRATHAPGPLGRPQIGAMSDRALPPLSSEQQHEPTIGWRASEVVQELPQLRLVVCRARLARAGASRGRSPRGVERRLQDLSNRYKGARAVGVRREPVPSAYRVFYRQIGLDPDLAQTPIEAAVLERMMHGGFLSEGLLNDMLLIALIDTGVPIWALDAASVDGDLGVRLSREGESLGRASDAWSLPAGRLVIADVSAALGLLFGELAEDCEPTARTRELALFAVQVSGVPTLYVEEALWTCRNGLEQAR